MPSVTDQYLQAELARIRSYARRYHDEMGFSIIPCHHGDDPRYPSMEAGQIGKRALVKWEDYQKVTPSNEDIDKWFYRGELHNIAIITGGISRVVVLDLDDEVAKRWADSCLPKTKLRVATLKGEHRYYLWNTEFPIKNKVRIRAGGLVLNADIRGEGGYVIAAGSRHASGHIYAALPDDSSWTNSALSDLPYFPHEFIESSEPKLVEPCLGVIHSGRTTQNEQDIIAYMAMAEGESEGSRNNAGFWYSANLLIDFDSEPAFAWNQMLLWNQKNSPPMSIAELKTAFESGGRCGNHVRGCKVRKPSYASQVAQARAVAKPETPPRPTLVKGSSKPSIEDRVASLLSDSPAAATATVAKFRPSPLIPMVKWNDIPRDGGWKFIIEPCVPRAAVTIISGDGGLGKSLLACRLVANLANGLNLLGKPLGRTFRSTVYFMEDALGEIKRRLEDMGHLGGDAINIFDNRESQVALTPEYAEAIYQSAVDHESDVVVIDPLISAAAAADVKMNDPESARACVDLLTDKAKRGNMAIVLVHHHNSGGTIQGGKAWENAVRSHLTVHRHPLDRKRYLVLHAKHNCGEMTSFAYALNEALPGVRSTIVAEVLGEAPGWNYQRLREASDPRKIQDPGCLQEAILFLREHLKPGWSESKKNLVDKAARSHIRSDSLNQAATSLGVERVFVRQPDGPSVLCWQMPEGVVL